MALNESQLAILKQIDGSHLPQLPQDLTENAEFVLEAVDLDTKIWAQVSPILKSNKAFMLLAIDRNSYAFMHASDGLKDDEDVAIAAIKQDNWLLNCASERLRGDESFKNRATKVNSWFPIIRLNKIIKNGFFEGISDAFAIMYGDYAIGTKINGGEVSSNRLKYGLVDITLIPLISNALINFGRPNKPLDSNPFKFGSDPSRENDIPLLRNIALFIGLSLQVARLGMAIMATILVLPVIAVVHVLKSPYAYYQQRKLFALEGEICREEDGKTVTEVATLGDFANLTNSSLTDFCSKHHPTREGDITSASRANIKTEHVMNYQSNTPLYFFRPSTKETPSQKCALQLVKDLEINEKYDCNDFEDVAIGRSFI